MVHLLSKINDDEMLAEGLADSIAVLVDIPGKKSDNGVQYLNDYIKWYFIKDKYLAPSEVNETGVLLLSDLDTELLYRTAGTFFLYLFENYAKEEVISFAANKNPEVLDTTWYELNSKYKDYLSVAASEF